MSVYYLPSGPLGPRQGRYTPRHLPSASSSPSRCRHYNHDNYYNNHNNYNHDNHHNLGTVVKVVIEQLQPLGKGRRLGGAAEACKIILFYIV